MGQPAGGVLASIGALYTGTASFGGIQPVRVQRMLAASLATAVLTGLASLINRSDSVAIAGVTILAFLLALVGSLNSGANLVAIQAVGALIVVSGIPSSSAAPLGNCLLVLAGGVFQTALLSLFGPIAPFSVERTAVSNVFRGLANFVRVRGQAGAGEIPESEPFLEAIARLEEAEFHGLRPEHLPLIHSLRVAETIRAALVGYARAFEGSAESERVGQTLLASSLDAIGDWILAGATGPAPQPWAPAQIEGIPKDKRYWLEMIRLELVELESSGDAGEIKPFRWSWIPRLRSLTAIFDSKVLQGMTLIHAIRYALVIGLSVAVARYSHVNHSYWFPLTVAFILRSDYATTLSRGIGRAAGTVVGVGFASLVDLWLHPSVPVLIGLVILSTWFAYSIYQANYSGYALAVTLFVVFSIAATGLPENEIGQLRMIATLLGVVVAVAFALLWPLWQSGEVRPVLADAFAAQAAYGREVEKLLEGQVAPAVEDLRRKARAIRIDAQKLVAGALIEPKWAQKDRLAESSAQLATLAAGAAEMLFIHAQALSRHARRLNDVEELRGTLRGAIQRAEGNSTVPAGV